MDINHDTDRFIAINYPHGAGGKFPMLCLAIHPKVLHQNLVLARYKMKKPFSFEQSFRISNYPLEMSNKSGAHFELNPGEMAGFNGAYLRDDPMKDDEVANSLWREMTNQGEYYFLMDDHPEYNMTEDYKHRSNDYSWWNRYKNRKNIILTNFEWLMKARKFEGNRISIPVAMTDKIIRPNTKYLDMESIKDADDFYDEMKSLFGWLDLECVPRIYLEKLRAKWYSGVDVGFKGLGKNKVKHSSTFNNQEGGNK